MRKMLQFISLAIAVLVTVVATPSISRAVSAAPGSGIHILWVDDDDPNAAGHNLVISVSLSIPDRLGTFYVYEGVTVPSGSPTPLATLEITTSADNESFVSVTNVGAATRFSIKYVPSNASYITTNFENIRAKCASGRYSGTGFGPCIEAPPGSYSIDYGATAPIPCVPGSYQPNSGAAACIQASPGSYSSASGAVSATLCPLGTYADNAGSTLCLAAPVGRFVNNFGSVEAILCPSGYTTSGMGSSICHLIQDALTSTPTVVVASSTTANLTFSFSSSAAVAGTVTVYSSPHIVGSPSVAGSATISGSTSSVPISLTFSASDNPQFSIKFESSNSNHNTTYWENIYALCGSGTYGVNGQTPCLNAPAGTFVPDSGSSSPTDCPAGMYQPEVGKTSCVPAPAGTYVSESRATQATPCPQGTFNAAARSNSASACTPSDPGHFVSNDDKTKQIPCTIGTFQSQKGQSICSNARIGYFVNKIGATSESRCKRGFTTSATGSTTCKRAPSAPKISSQLSRTKFTTVYLSAGRNKDGLRVRISTTSKNCKVTKHPDGYKLIGISRGACKITMSIQGNKTFASVTTSRNFRVI